MKEAPPNKASLYQHSHYSKREKVLNERTGVKIEQQHKKKGVYKNERNYSNNN